jgi:hypothetical protein
MQLIAVNQLNQVDQLAAGDLSEIRVNALLAGLSKANMHLLQIDGQDVKKYR